MKKLLGTFLLFLCAISYANPLPITEITVCDNIKSQYSNLEYISIGFGDKIYKVNRNECGNIQLKNYCYKDLEDNFLCIIQAHDNSGDYNAAGEIEIDNIGEGEINVQNDPEAHYMTSQIGRYSFGVIDNQMRSSK